MMNQYQHNVDHQHHQQNNDNDIMIPPSSFNYDNTNNNRSLDIPMAMATLIGSSTSSQSNLMMSPSSSRTMMNSSNTNPTYVEGKASTASNSNSNNNTSSIEPIIYQNHHLSVLSDNERKVFDDNGTIMIQQLQQQQQFPYGLAEDMVRNVRCKYPIRFWIIDNSGSMRSSDGMDIRITNTNTNTNNNNGNKGSSGVMVPCTRWTELQSTVEYHIQLASLLHMTTYFRFLNDPGPTIGPQCFSIATKKKAVQEAVASIDKERDDALSLIHKVMPSGVTPLTSHIYDIIQQVRCIEDTLRQFDQKVVIIIATDGLPSNDIGDTNEEIQNDFIYSIQQLQKLSVWIVIRLCTEDQIVVQYYNELDIILEIPLEVIDDYISESKEIYNMNSWLTYGIPIHRCREVGYSNRLFDLLDERQLNHDEMYEFILLLFGKISFQNHEQQNNSASNNNIYTNWKGFLKTLTHVVKTEGKVMNCSNNSMQNNNRNDYCKPIVIDYWINLIRLNQLYGKQNNGIMNRLLSPRRNQNKPTISKR